MCGLDLPHGLCMVCQPPALESFTIGWPENYTECTLTPLDLDCNKKQCCKTLSICLRMFLSQIYFFLAVSFDLVLVSNSRQCTGFTCSLYRVPMDTNLRRWLNSHVVRWSLSTAAFLFPFLNKGLTLYPIFQDFNFLIPVPLKSFRS